MERNPTVWRKIEKQSNPEMMNLLEGKSTLKCFSFHETSPGLQSLLFYQHALKFQSPDGGSLKPKCFNVNFPSNKFVTFELLCFVFFFSLYLSLYI